MKRAGIVAVATVLVSCGGGTPEKGSETKSAPVRVQTVAAAHVEWTDELEVSGTVRARQTATVASRLMAYVREVRVRVGDSVTAGEVVVVLDAKEMESAVRQAEAMDAEARNARAEVVQAMAAANAQLTLARATHKRMSDLFQRRSVTQQELDEATTRLRMAEAGVAGAVAKRNQTDARINQATEAIAAAKIQRGYLEIRSPFAGRVLERFVEPGNLASPGQPLLNIEQAGAFRLEAPVEEALLGAVRIGDRVPVRLESADKELDARVVEIVPAVDAMSRTFTVKLDLPGVTILRTGMFGRARFARGKKRALTAPSEAVREEGSLRYVMVADGGRARLRMVTLGAAREGAVEVLSGLSEGERVVHPLPAALVDGAAVEVR